MSAGAFFDTNILLYAGSSAPADAAKKSIAQELLLTVPFALSARCCRSTSPTPWGKKSLGLGESNISALLAAVEQVEVLPITRQLVIHACQLRLRYQVFHWDATIFAAALELGCKTLYTEDLNHGQNYGGVVRVANPFASVAI